MSDVRRNIDIEPWTFWTHVDGGDYLVVRHTVLMPGRREAVMYQSTDDELPVATYVREVDNFLDRFRPRKGPESGSSRGGSHPKFEGLPSTHPRDFTRLRGARHQPISGDDGE